MRQRVRHGRVRDLYKNRHILSSYILTREEAMGRKRVLWICTATLFIGAGLFYALAADMDAMLSELKRLKIDVAGPPVKQFETQLPPALSDANWGLKKIICEQGGYDLSPYAGKKVSLSCFPISEKYRSTELLNAWVVSSGDKVVCVYKAVRDNSSMAPGVFAVENPNAKEQHK
jgi:hypothetical protein